MAHKYWVELNYKDKRIGFDSLDKARENAIQMILIQGHKTPTRQANIYSTKTEYSTLKGATTFVGSVVRYSMEFRWIHYYYKEGITLALSDVINLDGKVVKKDPDTGKYHRYGKPTKIKADGIPMPRKKSVKKKKLVKRK